MSFNLITYETLVAYFNRKNFWLFILMTILRIRVTLALLSPLLVLRRSVTLVRHVSRPIHAFLRASKLTISSTNNTISLKILSATNSYNFDTFTVSVSSFISRVDSSFSDHFLSTRT